jgi:hypothetical protein
MVKLDVVLLNVIDIVPRLRQGEWSSQYRICYTKIRL